tara:strand:+ start:1114 stop:1743 length:630 start_codon:yes stop_codon:yes gene_type:complete
MKQKSADLFFDDVNFSSIVSTIKGIYTSDGSMASLLDFERVLDEADLYAFQNWLDGELVKGPTINRYSVKCVFMWPYNLMPNPLGAKRLSSIGCNTRFAKSVIKVPMEIKNEDDFVPGTHYPKMTEKRVWFIEIEIPKSLMNDIKEGSIDLAGKTIELDELENAYEEDLDKAEVDSEEDPDSPDQMGQPPGQDMMPMAPGPGAAQPPQM